MQIFFSCGKATSDVAFSFIIVQDFFYLGGKIWIDFLEPFGDILMYCGFGDSEFGGGAPYRCAGFDDVMGEFQYSLLYIIFHNFDSSPPHNRLTLAVKTIYVRGFKNILAFIFRCKFYCLWQN